MKPVLNLNIVIVIKKQKNRRKNMKQSLLNRNPEKILFFDMETASQDSYPELHSLFSYKNRDKDTDIESEEGLEDLWRRKAALNPIYGRVIILSVGLINKDSIRIKSFEGAEKEIIESFVELVDSMPDYTLCSWAAEYTLPYLRKRSVISGCKDWLGDKSGNDAGERPWSLKGVLSLGDLWKGISFYNDSIEEVAHVLGLKREETIPPHEISGYFHEGHFHRIRGKNREDVATLVNIFRRLRYEDPLYNISVSVNSEPAPLLEKIANTGKINNEDKRRLDKAMESVSEIELPYLNDIVQAVTSRTK